LNELELNCQVGERIAFVRKRLDISREELAERIGCGYQQAGKIERGQSSLTIFQFLGVCDALAIPPNALLHELCQAKSQDFQNTIISLLMSELSPVEELHIKKVARVLSDIASGKAEQI